MGTREYNFDSIVGPTHNYAGLAFGNLASQRSAQAVSNPRAAALEGLAKMKHLADLGIGQAMLPPQQRPDIDALRRIGFSGDDETVLRVAMNESPHLLEACSSASSMWAANAATVCPSADSGNGRVHFTTANLMSQFHRSLEAATTHAALRAIFSPDEGFEHHAPLPATRQFADEGAANHTRLGRTSNGPGLQLFVYGRDDRADDSPHPSRFPARQTRSASEAISRLHQLAPDRVLFLQQNPRAIDQGVFHNDVICVGNENVLLLHEGAFAGEEIDRVRAQFARVCGEALITLVVSKEQVSVAEAVNCYLFNSQLVTLASGRMALVAPIECESHPRARAFIDGIVAADNPIDQVVFVDVRQSMRNGGGPACLRLRVVLTEPERNRCAPGVFLDDTLYVSLTRWIERHYRSALSAADLADPRLALESRDALDSLCSILKIGPIYSFQQ